MKRRGEAVGIWLSHGVADALSTVWAARAVGIVGEANPIVRWLHGYGEIVLVLVMLSVVAVAAALWSFGAEIAESPSWIGYAVALVGVLVAIMNVAVALGL